MKEVGKIGMMATISGLILAGLSRFPILFYTSKWANILHGGGLVIVGIGLYIYCVGRNQ